MTEPPKYPERAVEVACAAQWGKDHWPTVPNAEGERDYMRKALDALRAMPPEAKAELIDFLGGDKAIEAATVQRIVAWLRDRAQFSSAVQEAFGWPEAAAAIEREFGARGDEAAAERQGRSS